MLHIDIDVLRTIGLNNLTAGHLAALDTTPTMRPMRIAAIHGEWMTVHDGHADRQARALPRLLSALADDEDALAVGDWVAVDDLDGEHWIALRAAPLTQVARRANDGRRQVLASNIDTALLVMGLDLDFNLRRLERYIAVVQSADIAPVVVLTKADIATEVDEKVAEVQRRLPAGIAVLAINGLSGAAAAALQPWLGAGQTLCLLGASGTGKSTLTNTLTAALNDAPGTGVQETSVTRKGDGRGRHTTTARSLHRCTGGACIVDTPGLRTWRPDADEKTLAATFDDIADLAQHCQFRDCQHGLEPGCAVRAGADPDRLANYHKLLRDARRGAQTPLDRIAERAKWKVIVKSAQRRQREKGR
ncbi:ribosome small subunit-dependent GTPase A [Pseudoduganella albidiflava]|uniref:Small ribosomal subunit biogenesis GTPase RsgA n=1 Tax=Pseudoduganella albidiflava TaxID=321983 RepID=A0A411X5L7_9BURK|nr:ribosome small subunit-dependent GTPase A [Pseudoduganella albidiflava]QBI04330.1 ribosome small subunit-dependent GTPase A [Pseudoduganella albidiflava]GGY26378.1 putative ribosome biogenesis GTPase RsgA [Pseudoduganella albidiflava]